MLIGSRALAALSSSFPKAGKETDYDYIGAQKDFSSLLSQLDDLEKVEKVFHPFTYFEDALKDVNQWKHFDKTIALEHLEKIKDVKGVTVYHIKTADKKIEFEISQPLLSSQLISEAKQSLELQEAIRTSHIIFPNKFLKHIKTLHDIRTLMKFKERSKAMQEIVIKRRVEHYLMFGVPGRYINLEKSNEDFLENEAQLYVDKYMKHDDIHLLVKYDKEPAYYNLRHDKTKARIDYDLFMKADFAQQLNCVKEEAMVLALERYLLPKRDTDSKTAILRAMNRICTTITKGWFREFAVDHFYEAYDSINVNLLEIRDKIYKVNEKEDEKSEKEIEKKEDVNIASIKRLLGCNVTYVDEEDFYDSETDEDEEETEEEIIAYLMNHTKNEHCQTKKYDLDFHFEMKYHNGFKDGGWCDRYNYWYGEIAISNDCTDLAYRNFKCDHYGCRYTSNNYKDPTLLTLSTTIAEEDSLKKNFNLYVYCHKFPIEISEKAREKGITEDLLVKVITRCCQYVSFDRNGETILNKYEDGKEHAFYNLYQAFKDKGFGYA